MPTLHWVGKDKVVNHHHDVPFRVLDKVSTFSAPAGLPANSTDNRIIHGDNLEALKSLLPEFEGRVKCIYIDPPYNTGNEGWVYNDAVNDPKIKRWLGQVVGKEGEDLSRHDKWLCMMYPRLKLLRRLLSEDGVILMSLDGNEHRFAELLMDEIFGSGNRIETFIWKKSYGGGAKSKQVVNLHEYILCFARDRSRIGAIELPPNDDVRRYYKFEDEKSEVRGPYRLQPLATNSMDARPNLRYPISFEGEEIWPEKQWQWARDRAFAALEAGELVIKKIRGKWSVNYKQYLRDADGEERGAKLYSIVEAIYTQQGTNELKAMFGDGKTFDFPKPTALVLKLIQAFSHKDSLVLDSFAGSGTTGQAVLAANVADAGNRRFLLIETEGYADTITAERIRRVMSGYGEGQKAVNGLGGSFDYYTVGEPMFLPDDNLNEAVGCEAIRGYVAYSEGIPAADRRAADNPHSPYLLGLNRETAWIFHYEPERATSLDMEFLSTLRFGGESGAGKPGTAIIYADRCLLSAAFMTRHGIIFKKIPRDITRF